MSKEYGEEFKIEKIEQECPDTKTFILDKELRGIMPGQFVMVNVTKNGEKIGQRPFSPSYTSPLGITVKRRLTDTGEPGKVTSFMLDRLETDDILEIQGPNGNSFLDFYDPGKTAVLVAGGCGAAPMRSFAECLRNYYIESGFCVFLGAPSEDQLLFEKAFKIYAGEHDVFKGIDEPGKPGKILKVLRDKGIREGSQVYVCGPRPLLKAAAELASQYIPDTDIILSTEEIIKCGRGLCGSCGVGGYRACQDGPSFTYRILKEIRFFDSKRLKSGRIIPL